MSIGQGLAGLMAGPLAASMLGATLAANLETLRDSVGEHARYLQGVVGLAEHRGVPEATELGPYGRGQVLLYQRLDDAASSRAVHEDYQGNVYLQDVATGQLQVLPLRRFYRPTRQLEDWMSHSRLDDAEAVPSYLKLAQPVR